MYFDYVVYKITFPNGKIYIGKDVGGSGHSLNYFGSWSQKLVEKDFTKDELANLTIRKEIIYESKDKLEIGKKESEFIKSFRSNEYSIGYNQTHKKMTA